MSSSTSLKSPLLCFISRASSALFIKIHNLTRPISFYWSKRTRKWNMWNNATVNSERYKVSSGWRIKSRALTHDWSCSDRWNGDTSQVSFASVVFAVETNVWHSWAEPCAPFAFPVVLLLCCDYTAADNLIHPVDGWATCPDHCLHDVEVLAMSFPII